MKKIFIAAQTEESGKFYAFVIPIRTGENIKPILGRYKNTKVFHLCESRKSAEAIVKSWNEGFRSEGIFLYA